MRERSDRPEAGHSARQRATLALVTGFALALGAVGLAAARQVGSALEGRLDERLTAQAASIVSLTDWEDGALEFDYAPGVLPEFDRTDAPDLFQLSLDDGRPLFRSWEGPGDLLADVEVVDAPRLFDTPLPDDRAGRALTFQFRPGGHADVLDPTDRAGEPAPLRLHLAVATGRGDLDALLLRIDLGILVAVLLATLGSAWFTHRTLGTAFRSVDRLARDVADLDADRLDAGFEAATSTREIRPIARQLDALCERLENALARERRISGHIAHELRTPIAELKTLAEVAGRWPDDPATVRDYFADVRSISGRMDRVVADLLLLARCNAGIEPKRVEVVDPVALVESVWRELGAAGRTGDAELQLASASGATRSVSSDPSRLRLILHNLLHNAATHRVPGAPIRCAIEPGPHHELRLILSNPAAPLAEPLLDHLTEPFWRGDPARTGEQGHTGLGLTLAAALCDLLDLTLHLEQDSDGTFRAVLGGLVPHRDARPDHHAEPPNAPRSLDVPVHRGRVRHQVD